MLNYSIDDAETVALAETFKALGNAKRLQILDLLMEGVQCNCELSGRLGLSLSLISHHMRVLERTGLVRSQRDAQDARWIYYLADPEALRALRRRFDALTDPGRIRPRVPACGPQACRICGSPPADTAEAAETRGELSASKESR